MLDSYTCLFQDLYLPKTIKHIKYEGLKKK